VISPSLLLRWYATLATVAALLATQAILLPPWPKAPAPLPALQLEAALAEARLLSPSDRHSPGKLSPAMRSQELVTLAPVVVPLRGGFELTLVQGSVRQRFNFQTSIFGRNQPRLKLSERRLVRSPVPTAKGLAEGRPVLQTCLVRGPGPQSGFGVTRQQLTAVTDRLSSGEPGLFERLIGLQPHRTYGCTLISLRGPKGSPPSDGLWQQVLGVLEPVLESQN
jgi:hypothetical protein